MKTTFFNIVALVAGFSITGCTYNEEKTAAKLLEAPEMREAIYKEIANDTTYLSDFVAKLMKDNNLFLKTLCTSENMDSLLINQEVMGIMTTKMIKRMEQDSIVCDKTCYRLMESDQLNKYFKKHGSTQWNEGKSEEKNKK